MLTGSTPLFYTQQTPLGAFGNKSVQVYAGMPLTWLAVERCAIHFQTCQNGVTIGCIAFATRLIHKLPLFVDLPSLYSIILLTACYFAVRKGRRRAITINTAVTSQRNKDVVTQRQKLEVPQRVLLLRHVFGFTP